MTFTPMTWREIFDATTTVMQFYGDGRFKPRTAHAVANAVHGARPTSRAQEHRLIHEQMTKRLVTDMFEDGAGI